MKLFQRLLVAPAALGLMAPIAVNAAELDLSGVSEYSEQNQEVQSFSDVYPTDWAFQALTKLAETHRCNVSIPTETISRYEAAALLNKCLGVIASDLNKEERRLIDEFSAELAEIKGRTDDITAGVGEFEAGSFSSTTVMGGSAAFTLGSVTDGGTADTSDALSLNYAYGIDLNTSFRGSDSLYFGIEAGNASASEPMGSFDSAVASSDALQVASAFYTFSVGDLEIIAGPLLDQDDVIAATGSVYSGAYRHDALPFSVAGDETGAGGAVKFLNERGFTASVSHIAVDGKDALRGFASGDGSDVTTFSAGYNGDGFGFGAVVASNDGDNGDGYDTIGAGVYYQPESIPASISVAYDYKDPEGNNEGSTADRTDFFIGVEYEAGPGVVGIAYTTTDVDDGPTYDQVGYEIVYAYNVNDNITVTPGLFYVEETTANKQDDSGVFVETSFSF